MHQGRSVNATGRRLLDSAAAREPDSHGLLVVRCGSPSASVSGGCITFFGRSSLSPLARVRAGNISNLNGPGRWLQRRQIPGDVEGNTIKFCHFRPKCSTHVAGRDQGTTRARIRCLTHARSNGNVSHAARPAALIRLPRGRGFSRDRYPMDPSRDIL